MLEKHYVCKTLFYTDMFVDRINEQKRIIEALGKDKPVLLAVYGRRRCGKSTLLKKILSGGDIYFAADLRKKSLQMEALAGRIENTIRGFSSVKYPDWDVLFQNLGNSLNHRITLCIDEFPYLVKNSPELPSLIQNIIDNDINRNYNLILCGSSQQMMEGMVLNSASPLYGRCDEILNIKPMSAAWFREYFQTGAVESVEGYGIFGGVPRYWELLSDHDSIDDCVKYHLLDTDGILYREPEMLFYDEMRTSVMVFSILTLVGVGCNRLSEIATRLEKPATQLNRPVKLLMDLGYIRRETPYNISPRSTKKSLYKISDPFMNFYFTFVVPNKSRLEYGLKDEVWHEISKKLDNYNSGIWEELCRSAVPGLKPGGMTFNPAARWWGTGLNKKPMEIDIVTESTDKSTLFIAEAKWTDKADTVKIFNDLQSKSRNLPFAGNHDILHALFLKSIPEKIPQDAIIFTADDAVQAQPE
ncbi:MAG: ATP-binding protein [Bacteroidota bacterium]|nr:ATP-binding protein [Bacteroidota bacterium]